MKIQILILLIPLILSAQMSQLDINGYAKYLFTSGKSPGIDKRLNDHLIHSRINMRWFPSSSITTAMEVRLRGYYGDSVEEIPSFISTIKSNYDYELDAEIWNKKRTIGYGEIDRLYIDYLQDDFQVTLGRQRVAWGASLVWNVIDLFNPMSILDFDYEERPGMDAVRLQYFTSELSKLEFVYKVGKNKYSRSYAGLFTVNYWDYDFFILAAMQNNRKTLGGAWSGDIKGGGFRGEFKYSEAPSKGRTTEYPILDSLFNNKNLTDYKHNIFSGVLSGDYTFSNTLYIHSEVLYNSNGKTENAGLFWYQISEASMLSPARWSLFQEFAYDITPLLRANVFIIFNPDDHSSLLAPSIKWSLMTNLELMSVLYTTSGQERTEFGNYGNSFFLRLKYSF
ncbi:MAG: hypothetical protein JW956_08935 [Calditrichaceae bacterium]|nr:hypothetical protein [Calditrichaceae bacterium]